jgi:tetratricopeptide (TPR) repeat protein
MSIVHGDADPAGPSAAMFAAALARHREGDLGAAERHYRAILAVDRRHYGALAHLGVIRLQQGGVEEALGLFGEARDGNPAAAEAHANLANALLAARRYEEAAAGYETALAIDPDHAEAHYGLGTALRELKRHEEAIAAYRRALTIDPDYAEAAYGLAAALQKLDRHAEALAFYQAALAVDPDYFEAHYGLATALQTLERHEEAIRHYDRALAIAPDAVPAHNNRGAALLEMGRLDEARRAFERAVTLDPKLPASYLRLLEVRKVSAVDRHFLALKALARDADRLAARDRIDLHFALGRACSQVAEPAQSFRHYLAGNALKRREIAYDEAEAMRMFGRIRATFTAELLREKAGQGDPSPLPVFIVGMPRSGSTLVEQILASHPLVCAAGERLEFRDALNGFAAQNAHLPLFERFRTAGGEELRRLGTDYLDRLKAAIAFPEAAPWRRITDKMPSNFRVLGLIHLALPNARVIHTRRDPVDTCLSCFSTLFAADQPYAYDLGELGRYYRAYAGLMAHWRRVLPQGLVLDVHYEELVADFEPQARRILAHCGLEWDDRCLAFNKTQRPIRTASMTQVRQPIYKTSIGRPRPDPELLQPLLDGLGPALAGAPAAEDGPAPADTPGFVEEHVGFADALLAAGRFEDAAAEFDKALALDPRHAQANFGLASVLRALDRNEEAIAFYEEAIAADPGHVAAACALAATLQSLHREREAAAWYERALALDPDNAEAHFGLGAALYELNRHAEAIPHYDRAAALVPGLQVVHNNRGVALSEIGRLDEAAAAFENAIALAPKWTVCYKNLFNVRKATPADPHVAALERLAGDAEALPPDDRIELHFALGLAHSQIGDHREAFRHYLAGNALKRAGIDYPEIALRRMLERIRATFTAELLREKAGQGDPSPLPVFIVGMPRSGSTLIEQILASHPLVFAAGERNELGEVVVSLETPTLGARLPYPETFRLAEGAELRRLGGDYLARLKAAIEFPEAVPWRRITDKMPSNYAHVGMIRLVLPNARIIHTCRDPVDTCLSCFSTLFSGEQPFAYDLGELGRHYRDYAELMAHWRRVLPAGVMLDVHYEELVADFEAQARRIVAHCGLAWDDRCLAFDKTARPVNTASKAQVRQPIYKTSVGRPRPDPELLRPLLDGLGPDLAGA